MASRSEDWFRQSERDLAQARASQHQGWHEWACFAAHQAAEKAIKALHLANGQEAWGHVLAQLMSELPSKVAASPELVQRAQVLDNFYIPTRYPDSHPAGAPFEHYNELQSGEALSYADQIVEFVRNGLAGA
jgi:HEPN domain-containing protein